MHFTSIWQTFLNLKSFAILNTKITWYYIILPIIINNELGLHCKQTPVSHIKQLELNKIPNIYPVRENLE